MSRLRTVGMLALVLAAGCGGGSAAPGGGTSGGIVACTQALIPGSLVSPAPGAVGVSTSVGTISFSVSDGRLLSGSFSLIPTTAGGATVFGGPISGTAASASVAVPSLQPRTTYNAALSANFPEDPCNPRGSFLGQFTTA